MRRAAVGALVAVALAGAAAAQTAPAFDALNPKLITLDVRADNPAVGHSDNDRYAVGVEVNTDSGASNVGFLAGGKWVTDDKRGLVLELDGKRDRVEINNSPDVNAGKAYPQRTIAFWFRPAALDKGDAVSLFVTNVLDGAVAANSDTALPLSSAVMSHGPLIPSPEIVSTTVPLLLSTKRHPACAVAAVPSAVGRLPTITQPDLSTTKAVVKPTPPGHGPGSFVASICANNLISPSPGGISPMVVPVP